MNLTTLQPRWASAPGTTIVDLLQQRGHTVEDLADHLGIPDPEARRLVLGEEPITASVAEKLANWLGGSRQFWEEREQQFQESRQWVAADELAGRMPFDQMASLGWVDAASGWQERANSCLEFFGAKSADEWNARWGSAVRESHFRASSTLESDEAALAAWLRQAQRQAEKVEVEQWNSKTFRDQLNQIRGLTKIRDPEAFVPRLVELCAHAGVAVVVVRAPRGCPVSGAAFSDEHGRRVIALSGRHRADDHLWFTFFHEAGHLLLHDTSTAFLDELEPGQSAESAIEQEADAFAQIALLPHGLSELESNRAAGPTARQVLSVASTFGIAPGIVVGQLQYAGILGYNRLNSLKRRYRWDGPILKI